MAKGIHFISASRPVPKIRRNLLIDHITAFLLSSGYKPVEVNYIFVSDDELLIINKQHLNHDYLTDIITFDLSIAKRELIADIYISLDRVRDNARQFNQLYSTELLRVVYHGILHLIGYKDKLVKDQMLMRGMEDQLITEFLKRST